MAEEGVGRLRVGGAASDAFAIAVPGEADGGDPVAGVEALRRDVGEVRSVIHVLRMEARRLNEPRVKSQRLRRRNGRQIQQT